VRTKNELHYADVAFGISGCALIVCSFLFAAYGTPRLPPAPIVLLGISSPLTGMTRSFVALAGGHLAKSFAFHPLGPLCFAASVASVANALTVLRAGRRAHAVDRLVSLRYNGAIVAAVFGLVWIRQIIVFS
jgi:hypothetical protein